MSSDERNYSWLTGQGFDVLQEGDWACPVATSLIPRGEGKK